MTPADARAAESPERGPVPHPAGDQAPPPQTQTGRDGPGAVAAVAAAMLAYVMAGAAVPLRLKTERIRRGVLLHITYPPASNGGPPHHLTAVDSLAERWGVCGDSDWHLLWAIVAAGSGP